MVLREEATWFGKQRLVVKGGAAGAAVNGYSWFSKYRFVVKGGAAVKGLLLA